MVNEFFIDSAAFHLLIAVLAGLIVGMSCVWFFLTHKFKRKIEMEKTESTIALTLAEDRLAAKQQKEIETNQHLEDIENSLSCQQEINQNLSIENATLKEKLSTVPQLEDALSQAKQRIAETDALLASHQATIAELKTLNTQQRHHAEEKIAFLKDAKIQLMTEFQNLANRIFEEKSSHFTHQNRVGIDNLLIPFREQLNDLRNKVEDVYDKETRDRVSLFQEIKQLRNLNQQISQDAVNLTNALKGDNKRQGCWGEVILERVLEAAGLQKGREYDVQKSLRDQKGNVYRPDIIIRLPEGKDIVIDSKVSLKAWEKYSSAEKSQEKMQALKAHHDSIRNHIKILSTKNYHTLKGIRSLDFVLLFIPIEAAFLTAVEAGLDLFDMAFKKNIMLICPSTLLATLRIVQNIWRQEDQNRNSAEIAKKSGDLYNKIVGFVDALEDIGKQLDKAKNSYTLAHKRLFSGNGNLLNRTEELKQLGVSAKKELSEALLKSSLETCL